MNKDAFAEKVATDFFKAHARTITLEDLEALFEEYVLPCEICGSTDYKAIRKYTFGNKKQIVCWDCYWAAYLYVFSWDIERKHKEANDDDTE